MTLTKNYHVGICCFLIGSAIMLTSGAVVTWLPNNQFIFALTFILIAFGFLFLGVGIFKFFDEGVDTKPLRNPVHVRLPKIHKGIFGLALLIIVGVISTKTCKPMVTMYNTNIGYVNKLEKIQQERKMFYDKMWKTFLAKNDICAVNRETFITVTGLIMQGRADGQNVSWKFVSENQNIPYNEFTAFYKDLSNFVTSQRESYYQLETEAMQVVQKQNSMLDSFPNNMYNKVLGIQKLKYNSGFTSSRTEEVFKTHKEE